MNIKEVEDIVGKEEEKEMKLIRCVESMDSLKTVLFQPKSDHRGIL